VRGRLRKASGGPWSGPFFFLPQFLLQGWCSDASGRWVLSMGAAFTPMQQPGGRQLEEVVWAEVDRRPDCRPGGWMQEAVPHCVRMQREAVALPPSPVDIEHPQHALCSLEALLPWRPLMGFLRREWRQWLQNCRGTEQHVCCPQAHTLCPLLHHRETQAQQW
jgi:hypothetical protein